METKISKAHEQGANAVSWCPAHRVTDSGDQPYRKRLASCGNDKLIKIWVVDEKGEWIVEKSLPGHSDYVRDVAWCPVVNHSTYTIASCGLTDDALWHVSWSVCGTILSVSGEDNKIALWRENLQGQWQKMDDSDGKH
ncbi:hypothetical protein GCK32_002408 [Trichostrongylus colubriformis]|uniref:Protein SEC13 homolog n=1 Tax=Trichostrongylus colubriformis TaxID=6319 RepID=A0AAN8FAE3_TRICO